MIGQCAHGSENPTPQGKVPLGVRLAGWLGPPIVRALGSTWRLTVVNGGAARRVHEQGRPVLYVFWHGHMMPLGYAYRGSGICVFISWHRDGEVAARLVRGLGFNVERGSTSRGSVRGLVKMVSRARDGYDLAVTPDGPHGPARQVQRGTFYLAARSGAAIIPTAIAATRYKRLSSWDGFLIPLPFSKVAIVHGEPFDYGGPGETETGSSETASRLGAELERLTDLAESALLADSPRRR